MNDKTPEVKKPPQKRHLSPRRKQTARREFIRTSLLGFSVISLSMLGIAPVITGASARLRPPGALKDLLDEQQFLSSCIKCGQCVQVCPVEAIKLTDMTDGFGIGTPYIDAREQACDFSCDGLQCVLACPTGSLTHDINYPAESRMGFARLSRPDACLAMKGEGFKGQAREDGYQGKLRFDDIDRWNPLLLNDQEFDVETCDLCVRLCPIEIRIAQCDAGTPPSGDQNQCPPSHAIKLEAVSDEPGEKRMQPIILDGCVGCGVCEMVCPVQPTAIVIDIDKTADSV